MCKGVCFPVCLIEKGEGEKGSGFCSGGGRGEGTWFGDLKSSNMGGGLGNRLLVNGCLGGDFVNASTVVPGSFNISGFFVDNSTSGCFCPKSTKVMAFTVVCLVVSASMLVLGVVARMVGLLMKAGGLLIMVFSSFSSLSTRNLGWRGSPNKNGLCIWVLSLKRRHYSF